MRLTSKQILFLVFCGLLLILIFTRALYINSTAISHDEPFSIFHAQESPAQIIESLKPYNNPPLFEITLHYWMKITGGNSALQTRSLSLLFSILSIFPLFFMIKRYRDSLTAISVCLIFTFSSYHISYAHEARTYSMWLFFCLCCMNYFLKLVTGRPSWTSIVLYVLCSTAMIYSHFFGLWVLFAQFISVIASYKKIPQLKSLLFAWTAIFVLYIPYLLILLERFGESVQNGTWVDVPGPAALYENIRKFCNMPVVALVFLTAFTASLFIKPKDLFLRYMLIAFSVPYFLLFILSFKIPMYVDRYLIFTSIPFYISCVLAATFFKHKMLRIIFLLLLPAIMAITADLNPRLKYENDVAAKLVLENKTKETAVVFVPAWIDISIYYYCEPKLFASPSTCQAEALKKNYFATHNVDEIKGYDRVLLVEGAKNYLDPTRKNFDKLKHRYAHFKELYKADGTGITGYHLTLFTND